MERRVTDEGEAVFVDEGETRRGSNGPFFVVYRDAERTARFGYACSNCGSLDTVMDTMGRIVCNQCGNTRKPEEWDAAHE